MPRTTDLMVNIYGNDKSAGKTLKGVGNDADSASARFKKFGKVAATSLLAVGAAAGAFALSAAKAAAEDEKSQKRLANSIKNTAGATDAQVASTEKFITSMQFTYGVADDKLRPAFETLTRATGDLGESQSLMQTAMDVSAGTGKDLTAVSLALAKAHNGNIGALTRLGIPLDKSIIKNKDFNAALEVLNATFTGSAATSADTFAGRMEIVQQHLGEAKEQIGAALMPVLEGMATFLTETIVPNVQAFVDGLTGVTTGGSTAYASVKKWGTEVRSVLKWVGDNKQVVIDLAAAMATFWAVGKIAGAVSTMTNAFKSINTVMKATRGIAVGTAAAEAAASGGTMIALQALAAGAVFAAFGLSDMWGGMSAPSTSAGEDLVSAVADAKAGKPVDFSVYTSTKEDLANINNTTAADLFGSRIRAVDNTNQSIYWDEVSKKWYADGLSGRNYDVQQLPPPTGARALGGPVAAGASYLVGERGPELLTMGGNGFVTPNNRLGGMGGMTVIVNVAGSVTAEKDLAVTVRDNIAQLMRRRGLNPSILGV